MYLVSLGGGIGRRARLKLVFHWSVGSIPTQGTNQRMRPLQKTLLQSLLIGFSIFIHAQINNPYRLNTNRRDTIQKFAKRDKIDSTKKIYKPKAKDYHYWTEKSDTLSIDTTLSLKNYYRQTYARRDPYGTMLFPNIGQGVNELTYNPQFYVIPQMGFNAKRFNYRTIEDIEYFDVRTPVTQFNYQNGYDEGQSLETTFTHSPNQSWNYSVDYQGLRSLGRYRDQLASNSLFLATLNHRSRKGRYRFWTHYIAQHIDNNESGGIKEITAFEKSDDNFNDRQTFNSNLQGASSKLGSRRFHFVQQYGLLKGIIKKDSSAYRPISLQHKFTYQKQSFRYKENENNTFFDSEAILDKERISKSEYTWLRNELSAIGNINDKFRLEIGISYDKITYGYDSILVKSLINIPRKWEGTIISAIGKLDFDWNQRLKLYSDFQYAIGGNYNSLYQLHSKLDFNLTSHILLNGGINISSTLPNLNLLLNQSFYADYNYYNNFKNINTQQLHTGIRSNYLNAKVNFYNIDQYVFIDNNERPRQLKGSLNLFNLTFNKTFHYKHFGLDNTVTYQKVTQAKEALPLPEFIARNTLFYQTLAFKKRAEIQTGLSFYYFDKFSSREYFPILGEYSLQTLNSKNLDGTDNTPNEIGAYPLFDLFFNVKVKTMRIYLKLQHLNQLISDEGNYYSAPKIPFADWSFRIGIQWYLFV